MLYPWSLNYTIAVMVQTQFIYSSRKVRNCHTYAGKLRGLQPKITNLDLLSFNIKYIHIMGFCLQCMYYPLLIVGEYVRFHICNHTGLSKQNRLVDIVKNLQYSLPLDC